MLGAVVDRDPRLVLIPGPPGRLSGLRPVDCQGNITQAGHLERQGQVGLAAVPVSNDERRIWASGCRGGKEAVNPYSLR